VHSSTWLNCKQFAEAKEMGQMRTTPSVKQWSENYRNRINFNSSFSFVASNSLQNTELNCMLQLKQMYVLWNDEIFWYIDNAKTNQPPTRCNCKCDPLQHHRVMSHKTEWESHDWLTALIQHWDFKGTASVQWRTDSVRNIVLQFSADFYR